MFSVDRHLGSNRYKPAVYRLGKRIYSFVLNNPRLILLFISLLGFWRVGFFVNSLKWDAIDGYLVSRFFVGECLQNNLFPYWTPYQQLGFPIYANLISTWYPEIIIIGRAIGYTNFTLHLIFIFYIWMAGFGFYKLTRFMAKELSYFIPLIAAIFYMLSGFFVGNAQHINFVVAGAWLPWVFYYLFRLLKEPGLAVTLKLFLFAYLLVSGGYPSVTIFVVYIGGVFVLATFARAIWQREVKQAGRTALFLGVFLMLLGISVAGIYLSLQQVSPYIDRFTGMDYERTVINPFSPKSMLSLLFPFAAVKNIQWFGTDLSMTNAYMGFLTPVILLSLFIRERRRLFLFSPYFAIALFALFLSFGDHTVVFRSAYAYLPLFDRFRHVSIFRLLFILFALLAAIMAIANFQKGDLEKFRKFLIYRGLPLMIALYAFILIVSFTKVPIEEFRLLFSGEKLHLTNPQTGFFIHLVIQALINIFLIFLWRLLVMIKPRMLSGSFAVLLIVEMVISVNLNALYTVVYPEPARAMLTYMKAMPLGFPHPDLTTPLAGRSDASAGYQYIWRNTNTFVKTPSWDSFSPVSLSGFGGLRSNRHLLGHTIQQPLAYLAETLLPLADTIKIKDGELSPASVFADTLQWPYLEVVTPVIDTADALRIIHFQPDAIKLEVSSNGGNLVVLQQNYYPGWKLYINNKSASLIVVNKTLMACLVPVGKSTVLFRYENPRILKLFFLALGLWVTILLIVCLLYSGIAIKWFRAVIFTASIIFFTWLLIPRQPVRERLDGVLPDIRLLAEKAISLYDKDSIMVIRNLDQRYIDSLNLGITDILDLSVRNAGELNLPNTDKKYLLYLHFNGLEPPGVFESIVEHYGNLISLKKVYGGKLALIERGEGEFEACFKNDFEADYPLWSMAAAKKDSVVFFQGRHAANISGVEYGPTLMVRGDALGRTRRQALCKAMVKAPAGADLHMVLQIVDKTEKTKIILSSPIVIVAGENQWTEVLQTFALGDKVMDSDLVKAFVFNPSLSDSVFLDNFTVRFR